MYKISLRLLCGLMKLNLVVHGKITNISRRKLIFLVQVVCAGSIFNKVKNVSYILCCGKIFYITIIVNYICYNRK